LKIDGMDFLTDSTINQFNWGSTFWLSPQSDWNWPPSAEIDNRAYTVQLVDHSVVMTSAPDPKTGLVVTKQITGNAQKAAFVIRYTLTNRSEKPQKVAPWEVTRVKPNGIAFFPVGNDQARGGLLTSTVVQDGIFWYRYQTEKLPQKGDRQIYADGSEGWLAQVNGGVLLVKKFPDIAPEATAPKEGEVELFASEVSATNPGYVEIEHQGAYQTVLPGASTVWETTWILRKLPAEVDQRPGSRSLVNFVRKLIH
jgi:hypothetical protein